MAIKNFSDEATERILKTVAAVELMKTMRSMGITVPYAKVTPDFTIYYDNTDVVRN